MEKKEKAIYKVLEGYYSLRYNKLKKIVVYEKKEMSERPFRETLARMVDEGIVIRTETEKQNVSYSVDFESHKFEQDGIEYFDATFSEYEKLFDKFSDKREKLSKIDQSGLLLIYLKSLYLIKFRFDEMLQFSNQPQHPDLKVRLQNLLDIGEAMFYDQGEGGSPELDIYYTSDTLLVTEYTNLLDEFKQNLMKSSQVQAGIS